MKIPVGLTPKNRQALRLYATGMTRDEVVEAVGIKKGSFEIMVTQPWAQEYLRKVYEELDQEFQYLYKEVIDTIRDGLGHPDHQIKLAAASLWLRTNKQQKVSLEITAEDVIAKLLNREEVSGQIVDLPKLLTREGETTGGNGEGDTETI